MPSPRSRANGPHRREALPLGGPARHSRILAAGVTHGAPRRPRRPNGGTAAPIRSPSAQGENACARPSESRLSRDHRTRPASHAAPPRSRPQRRPAPRALRTIPPAPAHRRRRRPRRPHLRPRRQRPGPQADPRRPAASVLAHSRSEPADLAGLRRRRGRPGLRRRPPPAPYPAHLGRPPPPALGAPRPLPALPCQPAGPRRRRPRQRLCGRLDPPTVAKLAPTGTVLAEWRGPDHFGLFHHPSAVTVATSGTIYVADEGNHTVRALSSLGEPLARWAVRAPASAACAPPVAMCRRRGRQHYVADTSNARARSSPDQLLARRLGKPRTRAGPVLEPQRPRDRQHRRPTWPTRNASASSKSHPDRQPLAQWGGPLRLIVRALTTCRSPTTPVPGTPAASTISTPTTGGWPSPASWRRCVAVHLKVYQQRFNRRQPKPRLPPLTLDGPGEDGLGLAHLPVTPGRSVRRLASRVIHQSQRRPLPSDNEAYAPTAPGSVPAAASGTSTRPSPEVAIAAPAGARTARPGRSPPRRCVTGGVP